MLATYSSARADYGTNYTMQSILLVVLGGVSPNGGKGKISGVITAIVLLKMIESGINPFQECIYILCNTDLGSCSDPCTRD